LSPGKSGKIHLVEKQIGKKLELVKVPSGQDICGIQLMKMIKNVHDVEINEKGLAPFVAQIHDELKDFSKEELIERFTSVEFNRFLKVYGKAQDINVDPSKQRRGRDDNSFGRRGERGGRRERSGDRNTTQNKKRIFINVGKMDGFENKGQMLGFICNQTGIDGGSVGKIDLFDSFTFLGVEDGIGEKVISEMNGRNIEDRDIRVEFSNDKPRGERGGGDRGGRRNSGGGGDRGRRRSGGDNGGARNYRERRPRR